MPGLQWAEARRPEPRRSLRWRDTVSRRPPSAPFPMPIPKRRRRGMKEPTPSPATAADTASPMRPTGRRPAARCRSAGRARPRAAVDRAGQAPARTRRPACGEPSAQHRAMRPNFRGRSGHRSDVVSMNASPREQPRPCARTAARCRVGSHGPCVQAPSVAGAEPCPECRTPPVRGFGTPAPASGGCIPRRSSHAFHDPRRP